MILVRLLRLSLPLPILLAAASPAPATPIEDARAAFREADFEMALGILQSPLEDARIPGPARREALALAAQCHSRLDREDAAVDDLCGILAIEPRWQPDPTLFSPAEMRLFRVALATCPPAEPPPLGIDPLSPADPRWYQRRLVWIGAGAVAVTAAWLLGSADSGGGNGEVVVPGFPDPPSSAASP